LAENYLEWEYLNKLITNNDSKIRENFQNQNRFNKIYDYFYFFIRPWILRVIGVICATLTIILILSEITNFTQIKLCVFGFLIENSKNIYLLNLYVIIPLFYTTLCSLYGVFNLKIYGIYHISKGRKTDANSLLFLSGFICRIGFPLCFNFLQMLKLKNSKTSLEELLGVMDLFPVFGKHFIIFYPMILIILVLLNLFDVFSKLSKFFGIYRFTFNNYENCEIISDGNSEYLKSNLKIFLF